MALIECLDATPASPVDERLRGYYLEYPTSGSVAEAAALEVRGWVLGRQLSVVAVEICVGGRVIRRVPVDVRRDDVALAYPEAHDAQVTGFHTTLRMGPGKGHQLDVQAVLADQSRIPIAILHLRTRWRGDDEGQWPLVSIVIPCYRQAHYLHEAIESVLAQSYPHIELVVVDDGSPDNTSEVAARYPGVRCVRQPNRGVSEARNLGIRSSNGAFLMFLDADDRLLPDAVKVGLECFDQHPEVAFVSGRFRFIAVNGATLYERQGHGVEHDHFAEMLRRNYVAALCTVMFRRSVFESVAGFTPELSVCADYDLYLRVLCQFPAWSHAHEVAEYRRHGLGLSTQADRMLQEALTALRARRAHLGGNRTLIRAYRSGFRFWKALAADVIARQVREDWENSRRGAALRGLFRLRRCGWAGIAPLVRRGHTGVTE